MARFVKLFRSSFLRSEREFHQSIYLKNDNFDDHPFIKTLRVLRNDFKEVKRRFLNEEISEDDQFIPYETDILIIGGGAVGLSIAHSVMKRCGKGTTVYVVDKDPTMKNTSALLSVGQLHQQFSTEEFIDMALYGAEYMKSIKKNLSSDEDSVHFEPYGFLKLADKSQADNVLKEFELQEKNGVRNQLFSAAKLKERFPWLNVDGIEVANYGVEKQGWFDHWSFIFSMKSAAIREGVNFINGEIVDFEYYSPPLTSIEGHVEAGSYFVPRTAIIKSKNGKMNRINFACMILAAGNQSAAIGSMAKIGKVDHVLLANELPIANRTRLIYSIECEKGPLLDMPMILDPSKIYIRRDGLTYKYIVGYSPELTEPCPSAIEDLFHSKIHPILKNRIPCFSKARVLKSWTGSYGYNSYDGSGIIGPHPFFHNVHFATGFSILGIQLAPAIGRAFNELIIDGEFQSLDLTRCFFDRILLKKRMEEQCLF